MTNGTLCVCHVSSNIATIGHLAHRKGYLTLRGVSIEPYWRRIRRLRKKAGLSQPELFRAVEGVAWDTLRALEREPVDPVDGKRPSWRYPSADTLERIAGPLGVEVTDFPEYQLAVVRDLFDDRRIGIDAATANLSRFEEALEEALRARAARGPTPAGSR